jgi:hypothetical protein
MVSTIAAMKSLSAQHRRTSILVLVVVGLVVLLRRDVQRGRHRKQSPASVPQQEAAAASVTPTELAVELWGPSQNRSRGWGSRRVRAAARALFEDEAPGRGGTWAFSPRQAAEIRRSLARVRPPLD